MSEREAMTAEVIERLHLAGFALVGICDARASDHGSELRAWLEAGCHGTMSYMADHVAARLDPRVMVPGARSIICVADRHHDGRRERTDEGWRGRLARYARGGDYHELIRSRLEPLAQEWRQRHDPHRFRVCVDTAPIMEREHAMRAGLGRIGKHTLLIAEGLGSWLSLGEIVTTFPLRSHRASPAAASDDPCGSCTRCIDACPTGAIEPWRVDATRCLSYLTIEHPSAVPSELEREAGDWLFGCDDCQEVCPHNQPTRRSRRAGISKGYEPRVGSFDLLEVLGWTETDYEAAAATGVLRRASREMWKRSAIAILGNHLAHHRDAEVIRARIEAIRRDPSEASLVREAAARALDRSRDSTSM